MADSNYKIRTLNDLIDYGNDSELSEKKCLTVSKYNGIVLADDIVYDKYRDIIEQYKQPYSLTIEQQKTYIYRPEKFCYDVYGNPNLYHLILYINKCSESEFALNDTIFYIDTNAIDDVLKAIIINESTRVQNSINKTLV